MPSTLRAAFHISAFGWYTFIVNYLAAKDGEELPAGLFVYGGPWKYLTFLNLVSTISSDDCGEYVVQVKLNNFAGVFSVIANDVLRPGSSE